MGLVGNGNVLPICAVIISTTKISLHAPFSVLELDSAVVTF
jgi:hypothetical protein